MSAKRFSWFSMLASRPFESRVAASETFEKKTSPPSPFLSAKRFSSLSCRIPPSSLPFSIRRGATWKSHLPWREIMENIGIFACFPLSIRPAGGPPAPRHPIRFPPAFPCPRRGFHGFQCCHPNHSRAAKRHPRHSCRQNVLQAFLSAKRFSSLSCRFPPVLLPFPFRSGRAGAPVLPVQPSPFLFPPAPWRTWRTLREIMENIGVFACFPLPIRPVGGPPAPRHPIRLPPAFPCPRSGFHGFQCWHPSRELSALDGRQVNSTRTAGAVPTERATMKASPRR